MKRGYYLLLLLFAFALVYAGVDKAGSWHSASNILISIDGVEMTLQDAIVNGSLIGLPKSGASVVFPNPGHNADAVLVSVDGVEKTLQEVINFSNLCGSVAIDSYSQAILSGHYANEIEVVVNGTQFSFQDLIDQGFFCCGSGNYTGCYDDDVYSLDLCGKPIGLLTSCSQPCEDYGKYYCQDKRTPRRDRTCYDTGCSSGSCFSNSYIDSDKYTCSGSNVCVSGSCVNCNNFCVQQCAGGGAIVRAACEEVCKKAYC